MCHSVLHNGLARAQYTSMTPVNLLGTRLCTVRVLHTCVRVREEVCTHKRPRRMPESIYNKAGAWYCDFRRHLDGAQLGRSLDLDIWAALRSAQASAHSTRHTCGADSLALLSALAK